MMVTGMCFSIFDTNTLINVIFPLTGSAQGFRPICIYGRKARLPLTGDLKPDGKMLLLV
jgi:hypothetical protein